MYIVQLRAHCRIVDDVIFTYKYVFVHVNNCSHDPNAYAKHNIMTPSRYYHYITMSTNHFQTNIPFCANEFRLWNDTLGSNLKWQYWNIFSFVWLKLYRVRFCDHQEKNWKNLFQPVWHLLVLSRVVHVNLFLGISNTMDHIIHIV